MADSQQRRRPGERVQVPRLGQQRAQRLRGPVAELLAGGAAPARLGPLPDGLQPGIGRLKPQSQHRRQQPRFALDLGLRLVAAIALGRIDEAAGPAIDPVGVEQVAQPVGRPVPAGGLVVEVQQQLGTGIGAVSCVGAGVCGIHQVGSVAGGLQRAGLWVSSSSISACRVAIMSSGRCRRSRAISAAS